MRTEVLVFLVILAEALLLFVYPMLALSVIASLGAMVLYDLLNSLND